MVYVVISSVNVLVHPSSDNDVDITYIFIFSGINLAVDVICISFFVHGVATGKRYLWRRHIISRTNTPNLNHLNHFHML